MAPHVAPAAVLEQGVFSSTKVGSTVFSLPESVVHLSSELIYLPSA